MQAQNPHSLSNDPVAHAADTTSPHYGATVVPFVTATPLPIATGVFQSGEPQPDTHWRSEYMHPSNNTRSLNYGPVVQTADTTSSQYDITIASSATYVPGGYEHSQWNTGVHEEPTQSPHDRPTPTSSIPQSTEWSNFHRHSASIQERNDQSSHSGLPLVLPRTSSGSSRDPGRRCYRCADCGDILKSKQSLRGESRCPPHQVRPKSLHGTDHLEAIHKKNRRFTCSACGDTFLWKQSRNRHQRTRCLAIKAHSGT